MTIHRARKLVLAPVAVVKIRPQGFHPSPEPRARIERSGRIAVLALPLNARAGGAGCRKITGARLSSRPGQLPLGDAA